MKSTQSKSLLSGLSLKVKAAILVSLLLLGAVPAVVLSDSLDILLPPGPVLKQENGCLETASFDPTTLFDGQNVSAPRFCNPEVQFLLGPLVAEAQAALVNLNTTLWDLGEEVEAQYNLRHPHVPGNVLNDTFDAPRVGGFGDWTRITLNSPNDPWQNGTDTGNRHVSFGTSTGYPTGTDTWLVSPEVDLTTVMGGDALAFVLTRPRVILEEELARFPDELDLSQPYEGVPRGATLAEATGKNLESVMEVLLMNGVDPSVVKNVYDSTMREFKEAARDRVARFERQGLVTLNLSHRFNLANGLDGVRVEAFLEEPTLDNIATLQPIVLTPSGDDTDLARSNSTYTPEVRAFSRSPAFTGASDGWRNASFDLSAFAGRSVWLAFHAKTSVLLRENPQYFRDRERFQQVDYFGYALDNVTLNATQYPMNAQVKRITEPSLLIDGDVTVPPNAPFSATVLVRNAGLYTENITVNLTVLHGNHALANATPAVNDFLSSFAGETVRLKPGETRAVKIDAPVRLVNGNTYTLVAEAQLEPGPDPEAPARDPLVAHAEGPTTSGDNEARLVVRALQSAVIGALPAPGESSYASVHPPFAEEGVERTVRLIVENKGTQTARFRVTPFLIEEPCTAVNACTRTEYFKDFRANNPLSLARDLDLAPGKSATLTWQVTPTYVGSYDLRFLFHRISLIGGPQGELLGEALGRLHVGTAPPYVCRDDLGATRTCGAPLASASAPAALHDAWAAPDGDAYAAGAGGALLVYPATGPARNVSATEPVAWNTSITWREIAGTSASDLWLAADGGFLATRAGANWKNLTVNATGVDAAALTAVDLAVSSRSVWLLDSASVYRLDRANATWTRLALPGAGPYTALAHTQVGPNETLLLGKANGEIVLVNTEVPASARTLANLTGSSIRGVAASPQGVLFALNATGGAARLNPANGPHFDLDLIPAPTGTYTALSVASDNTAVAIGTNGTLALLGGAPLTLGARTPTGEAPFRGAIDEVRVSRIARDTEAVATNVAARSPSLSALRYPANTLSVLDAATVALYSFKDALTLGADGTGRNPLRFEGDATAVAESPVTVDGSSGALDLVNGTRGGLAWTPDAGVFDLGHRGTVEALVRPLGPSPEPGVIVSRGKPSGALADRYWELSVNARGQPEFVLGDGINYTRVTAPTPLKSGQWVHLAAAWDGFTVRLYVNGTREAVAPQTPYARSNPLASTDAPGLHGPRGAPTWRALDPAGRENLLAAAHRADGSIFLLTQNGIATIPAPTDATGDWNRALALTPHGPDPIQSPVAGTVSITAAPGAWLGGAPTGATATLTAQPDAVAPGGTSIGGKRYTDVFLEMRHAVAGKASLYLVSVPTTETPDAASTTPQEARASPTGALDGSPVVVPHNTANATPANRFLVASWDTEAAAPEWRSDALILDAALEAAGLSTAWHTSLAFELEIESGTWAIDHLKITGTDFSGRHTLLYTSGAYVDEVGRWGPVRVTLKGTFASTDDLLRGLEGSVDGLRDVVTDFIVNDTRDDVCAAHPTAAPACTTLGGAPLPSASDTSGNATGTVGRADAVVAARYDDPFAGTALNRTSKPLEPYWNRTTAPEGRDVRSLWRLALGGDATPAMWVFNETNGGNLPDGANGRLVTPAIHLDDVLYPTLTFRHRYSFPDRNVSAGASTVANACGNNPGTAPADLTRDPAEPQTLYKCVFAVGSVSLQVQNPDGTWGPFTTIYPETLGGSGYPASSLPAAPRGPFHPEDGYWGNSSAVCSDPTLHEARFNLTAQPLLGNLAGKTVRVGFHTRVSYPATSAGQPYAPSHCQGEGWYITDLKVKGAPKAALDLALTAANLTTPYDAARLGLGPGTVAPVTVNLTNAGLFPATGHEVVLEEYRVVDNRIPVQPAATYRSGPQPTLAAGRETSLVIPWPVPDVPDGTPILLKVRVIAAGDGDPTNDLQLLGSLLQPHTVRRVIDAAAHITVSPKAATAAIERTIEVYVENRGNLPLHNFTLRRDIDKVTASGATEREESREWDLLEPREPLAPGARVNVRDFQPEAIPFEETRWTAGEKTRYVFRATLDVPGDANLSNNLAFDTINAYRAFYEDSLDRLQDPAIAGYELGDGWSLVPDAGPTPGGKAFVFGDAESGRSPASADSSLVLPRVDITSASSAFLTFLTNFSFESLYDGGLVEARTFRGGAWSPWTPLTPIPFTGMERVRHPLHSGNPLVPDNDPTVSVPAFTNTTGGLTPDGWIGVSYNLGEAPNMSEFATFRNFDFESYANDHVTETPNALHPGQAVLTAKSWTDGVTGWFVDNPTAMGPRPKVGSTLWWSGSYDTDDDGLRPVIVDGSNQNPHTLTFTFDLESVQPDENVTLTFWAWMNFTRETGENGRVRQATDGFKCAPDSVTACIRFYAGDTTPAFGTMGAANITDTRDRHGNNEDIVGTVEGDWRKFTVDLTGLYVNATIPLPARSSKVSMEVTNGIAVPGRGLIIDGIQIEKFRRVGTDRADRAVLYNETDANIAKRPAGVVRVEGEPGAAWNEVAAPATVGSTWSVQKLNQTGATKAMVSYPDTGAARYLNNTETRLVSPVIDLTGLLGEKAFVSFREAHEFYTVTSDPLIEGKRVSVHSHHGAFEVSILDEGTGTWGPWVTLRDDYRGGNFATWNTTTVDVSDLIGQKVRFGFHVMGGMHGSGRGFAIDDFQLRGDVMTGVPMEIRLRAGTDASGTRTTWRVDNLQVVGTTYQRNLETSLDNRGPLTVAPGETFPVNGSLRNLGERTRDSLLVVLTPASTDLAKEPAAPTFASITTDPPVPTTLLPDGSVRIGPFDLLANGVQRWSATFATPPHPFAAESETFSYTVTAKAQRLVEDGLMVGITEDEVVTNLERTLAVTAKAVRAVEASDARATPTSLNPGETATVSLTLRSAGTLPVDVTLTCTLERVLGHSTGDATANPPVPSAAVAERVGACADGPSGPVRVAPGASVPLTWTLPAPEAQGGYRVTLEGRYARTVSATETIGPLRLQLRVGETFQALNESFEDPVATAEWRSEGQWAVTSEARHGGDRAFLQGVPFSAYETGATYAPGTLSLLTSPLLDLRNFSNEPLFLSFWHMPRFAEGDGGAVEARILLNEAYPDQEAAYSPWCRLTPEGGYPGSVLSFQPYQSPSGEGAQDSRNPDVNPLHPVQPNPNPSDGASATPAFSGFTDAWTRAIFPLTGQLDPRAGQHQAAVHTDRAWRETCTMPTDYTGRLVQLRFAAGTGMPDTTGTPTDDPITRGNGQGWLIDDVRLSPHQGDVTPLSEAWNLSDDAAKVFSVRIENPSPYTERFHVGVNPRLTNLPATWTVRALEDVVTVPAGGHAFARVEVTTAREKGRTGTAEFTLGLTLESLDDLNRVSEPVYRFTFNPRPWPDLRIDLTAPGESVQEGVPVTLRVTIENKGLVASPDATFRIVDTTTGEVIAENTTGILERDRAGDRSRVVKGIAWRPAIGTRGLHTLVATVDPLGQIEEYSEEDNTARLTVDVGQLLRPDLVIRPGNVRILTPGGEPATDIREGDVVRIETTVDNIGPVAARDASARVSIGPLRLPPKSLGLIPPGGNATVSFTWLAKAGEWNVDVRAQVQEVELNADNNAEDFDIVVKTFGVTVTVDETNLTFAPGEKALLTYTLVNEGNSDEHVRVDAILPPGFVAEGSGAEAFLGVGQTTRRTLTLLATDDALAGTRDGLVEVKVFGGGRDRSAAPLALTVTARHALTVAAAPTAGRPGDVQLPVTLENTGNSLDPIHLSYATPEGWTVADGYDTVHAAPGERVTLSVPLRAPATALATAYNVTVRATTGDADATSTARVLLEEVLTVHLTPGNAGYDEANGTYRIPAALVNAGNAQTEAKLIALDLPEGWELTTTRDRVTLDPGAASGLQVALKPPAKTPAGTYAVTLYADVPGVQPLSLAGQAARARVAFTVEKPDLTVSDLEITPRFNLQEGDTVRVTALVKNLGLDTSRVVPVHLYVDDKYVSTTEALVPSGENATVTLTWAAIAGKHTLTVAVDPLAGFAESDEDNNVVSLLATVPDDASVVEGIKSATNVPDVSVLAALALVGAVALVLRRRRPL